MWDSISSKGQKMKQLEGCFLNGEIDRFFTYKCPEMSFLKMSAPILRNESKNYYAFKFRIPSTNKGEVTNINAEWEMSNK